MPYSNLLTRRTIGREVDSSGRTPAASGSGAAPSWVLPGGPTIDMWFATSQYYGADPSQLIRRTATTGACLGALTGGTGGNLSMTGTWTGYTSGKVCIGLQAASQSATFNGGTTFGGSIATLPTTPTTLQIGSQAAVTSTWCGDIARIALWPSRRLTNAETKSFST